MRQKIRRYIATWEGRGYAEGLPDEAPGVLESLNKVPSYRSICMAIMKNDSSLLSLGYARPACEVYMVLKRIELVQRGVIRPMPLQRSIDL